MSDEHGPPKLLAGKDARPELRDALRALGRQDVDSARLARVADKLGPLFEGTSAATVGATLLRQAQRKVLLGRLVMAALAVGATAVWFRSAPPAQPVAPAVQTVQTPLTDVPVVPVEAAPTPALSPSVVSEPAEQPATRSTTEPRRARRFARSLRTRARPVPAPVAEQTSTPANSQDVVATSEQSPREEPPNAREEPAARPLGEVELLFAARKLMHDAPRQALVLLDEHKTRFADGQLAPEREVLAIEALRKLGQTAAVTARVEAFRARYPGSLHLRRLEQP